MRWWRSGGHGLAVAFGEGDAGVGAAGFATRAAAASALGRRPRRSSGRWPSGPGGVVAGGGLGGASAGPM
ncbi:MAG: hypothetical protein R3F65_28245 [bacterium]